MRLLVRFLPYASICINILRNIVLLAQNVIKASLSQEILLSYWERVLHTRQRLLTVIKHGGNRTGKDRRMWKQRTVTLLEHFTLTAFIVQIKDISELSK